jgi:hypothetical protein
VRKFALLSPFIDQTLAKIKHGPGCRLGLLRQNLTAPWRLELERHLFGGVELYLLVGRRRPDDAAKQLLRSLALC